MSKFMLDVNFSMYVKREMNVMSKGGVEVCHPYGVATWHWCDFFFCSNALIALARSLCKCLLAQLITASGANAVKGYLVRCACIDGTIP